NLSATLNKSSCGFNCAISGKTITFKLNNVTVGTATTDSSGSATLNSVSIASVSVGSHNNYINASFAGDATYSSDSDSATLTVNKATPTLSITNSPQAYTGSPIAAIVIGSVAGSVSNVRYPGNTSTPPTNVGTYAVTANFNPTDNTSYNSLA